MKIILTGSSGFLGNRLVKLLTRKGYDIIGLSRKPGDNIIDQFLPIDLALKNTTNTLKKIINGFSTPYVVIHLAAQQPGNKYVSPYMKNNVLATANLFDAICDNTPELIIYSSTHSVYGECNIIPVTETQEINCKTLYAVSKYTCEKIIQELNNKIIILRLPSMYGYGQEDSFIDGICKLAIENQPIELFGEGKTIRDAVHVSDIVKAVENCIETPIEQQSTIINLGCGEKITVLDYVLELTKALGSDSKIIPLKNPSKMNFYCDISNARSLIGYEPLGLHDSMKLYAKELKKQIAL